MLFSGVWYVPADCTADRHNILLNCPFNIKTKQKTIQSYSKVSECQNTAYFNLFLRKFNCLYWEISGLQRTATTDLILKRGGKPLDVICWSTSVLKPLVVRWSGPTLACIGSRRNWLQRTAQPRILIVWRLLAKSSKSERPVLHRKPPSCL
jgi:hypothetical protein